MSSTEAMQLPPLTDAEKAQAFEWLRSLAMSTRSATSTRLAYIALREWSDLKALHSESAAPRSTEKEQPTPRTDAAEQPTDRIFGNYMVVSSDFARQLERELAAAHEQAELDRRDIIARRKGMEGAMAIIAELKAAQSARAAIIEECASKVESHHYISGGPGPLYGAGWEAGIGSAARIIRSLASGSQSGAIDGRNDKVQR